MEKDGGAVICKVIRPACVNFCFDCCQVGIQLGGLESTQPAGLSAAVSASCRSILDFAAPSDVHPTSSTGVPSVAAEEASAKIHEDDRGAAGSLTSAVSHSTCISAKAAKKQPHSDNRLAKPPLTFMWNRFSVMPSLL